MRWWQQEPDAPAPGRTDGDRALGTASAAHLALLGAPHPTTHQQAHQHPVRPLHQSATRDGARSRGLPPAVQPDIQRRRGHDGPGLDASSPAAPRVQHQTRPPADWPTMTPAGDEPSPVRTALRRSSRPGGCDRLPHLQARVGKRSRAAARRRSQSSSTAARTRVGPAYTARVEVRVEGCAA